MLTADPTAHGPIASAGSPVPGHSVTGCSRRLIVSTRGSRGTGGMAVLADGGSAMMKSYVFECDVSA
jgi:hypothetical protein